MIGPSLPNPFETTPAGRAYPPVPGDDPSRLALDAAVTQALRSAPLEPPPPLLYAVVMHRVRQEPRPRFRATWLDVSLSAFAAGMLIAIYWAWRSLPPGWLAYLRLLGQYQIQKAWYLDFPLVAWSAAAAAGLLLACLAAAVLLRPPTVFRD